ncbi:conserved hypothetical protein [Aster yellows witches'-broom phytoplasma AYWB]|uniref:Uncharacterized protein n=1 Tax=Aster yellows witches'-broom phytoplasma (strain AYWB) TaxID=322098 RepID=Q2NJC4_AYWBP|nr:DUF2963 domain-containing protein [Aster yellows witches'-broom phytoplasma]ABC65469.1 conserved hypothetical protein [Aster yellows witches'-broom phytoplasma AYWB]
MEYNPINSKLMKRKNIDDSIEEFDDNAERFKEIDKNGKVKYFKTKIYKNISDFKKLFINDKGLEINLLESRIFNLKDLKASGYTLEQLISFGYSLQDLKDAGYISIEEFENLGYNLYELRTMGYISVLQIIIFFPSYDLNKLRIAGYINFR